MKLSAAQRELILKQIESIFETTKARLLGRFFKGPRIYFTLAAESDPLHTLEGLYNYTLNMMYGAGTEPKDEKVIENLSEVTGNYFDAQKLKVANHLLNEINDASSKKDILSIVAAHIDKASKYIDMLTENEMKITTAYATREGITQLAADLKINDPTVVFLGVVDQKVCKYCKSMYHNINNLYEPKPYKLSQVQQGYFKPKLWDGKTPFMNCHPRCRHVMSFVSPGFGFTPSGQPTYISSSYDYYKDFWSMRKTEEPVGENLNKSEHFMDYDEYLIWSQNHETDLAKGHVCESGCKHD